MSVSLDNDGWRALLNTLLGKLNISYDLEISEDSITLAAQDKDVTRIQNALQNILRTPSAFFENLPYKISTSTTMLQSDSDSVSPPTLANTFDEGINFFRILFGDASLSANAISVNDLFNAREGARVHDYVLYSKPASSRHRANLWRSMLESLLVNLNGMDVSTARQILTRSLSAESLSSPAVEEGTALSGLIQHCFGVISENNHKKVTLYFNYGLLYRYIFPPSITRNKFGLTIEKRHLLNYMQQLTQGGALLRVYRENEQSSSLTARPLFLGSKKNNTMKHHYTLIIDRSGSMSASFNDLKNHVINFIDELKTFDPSANLRIVYFESARGPIREFTISNSDQIRQFIRSTETDGGTQLFNTVEEEVRFLADQRITQNHNTAAVLFTDGWDDNSRIRDIRDASLQRIATQFNRFKEANLPLPKFFTMGVGNYDNEALNLFSSHTQTPFIHLQSFQDFNQIYQYLSTFQYETTLMDFLIRTHSNRRFTIPVLSSGNAISPNILIPFAEREPLIVEANGRQLTIEVEDITNVPVATLSDQINALLVKVNTALVTESNAQSAKNGLMRFLSEAQDIQHEFNRPNSGSSSEINALAELNREIQRYILTLDSVIRTNNNALHQSLQSQARHALGYTVSQEVSINTPVAETMDSRNYGVTVGPVRKLLSIEDADMDVDVSTLEASSATRRVVPLFQNMIFSISGHQFSQLVNFGGLMPVASYPSTSIADSSVSRSSSVVSFNATTTNAAPLMSTSPNITNVLIGAGVSTIVGTVMWFIRNRVMTFTYKRELERLSQTEKFLRDTDSTDEETRRKNLAGLPSSNVDELRELLEKRRQQITSRYGSIDNDDESQSHQRGIFSWFKCKKAKEVEVQDHTHRLHMD